MRGKIVRGVGGLYYVHIPCEGKVYECRAKGVFRRVGLKPLPGDLVKMAVLDQEKGYGNIEEILPRKNVLIRPAVANIDQALVIFALKNPSPGLNLLDRFLIQMQRQQIPIIVCFNKIDLVPAKEQERIRGAYRGSGYRMLWTSAKTGDGLEELASILHEKTTTVAGPSGVGKSSLINCLQSEVEMETGAVSERIGRGRHTTRHTALLCLEEGSYILDTPGFSSIALDGLEKEELGMCFPEIGKWEKECRFVGCSHISEPDCAVKRALAAGEISTQRYENYRLFYEELKEKKRY